MLNLEMGRGLARTYFLLCFVTGLLLQVWLLISEGIDLLGKKVPYLHTYYLRKVTAWHFNLNLNTGEHVVSNSLKLIEKTTCIYIHSNTMVKANMENHQK